MKQIGVSDGWRIMDAGSGDGVFAFYVAHRHPNAAVLGLELNGTEVRVCRRVAAQEGLANLSFVEGIPESVKAEPFDLVYCLDVLEHIQDDVSAVRAMRDKLKPGGVLLVHVPNRHLLETDGRFVTVPDDEAWKVNPGHVRAGYTPAELRRTLESAGLSVEAVLQTQGRPIARAHKIYAWAERSMFRRLLILPAIDYLAWRDRRRREEHGNTVWAIARKTALPSNP